MGLTLPSNQMGPKWTQKASLIGANPGVGLRPQNADAKIDSQMFVLKKNDINKTPTNEGKDNVGEGELNADYAARMSKFMAVYNDALGQVCWKFLCESIGCLERCGSRKSLPHRRSLLLLIPTRNTGLHTH